MDSRSPLLLLLLLQLLTISAPPLPSPYLSPSFFPNYQKMLKTFKIFIYNTTPPPPHSFNTTAESLFHASLLDSSFVTTNPDEAHLFYLHFAPTASHRSISRAIRDLQVQFPFWNRTLGADHFFLSCNGVRPESDRNLVELKKNSIQVSCFGEFAESRFIPHKDIVLPPLLGNLDDKYIKTISHQDQEIVSYSPQLTRDFESDSVIDHKDESIELSSILSRSKFCLFMYGGGDVSVKRIGEALRHGCVPVAVVVVGAGRPMGGLVFADVLRWAEVAVFVEGVEAAKRVVGAGCGRRYEEMREMGMVVRKHFDWSLEGPPQPYDGFHMVLYQLWLRRHTIRYKRTSQKL